MIVLNCILSLALFLAAESVFAISNCSSMNEAKCLKKDYRNGLEISQCEIQKKVENCDSFFQENPEAKSKERNCNQVVQCTNYLKLKDYGASCAIGMASSIKDFSFDVYYFIVNDIKMPPEMKEREEFFNQCTSADCKRKMLGPYVGLFSKEEIEGNSGDNDKLNKLDPVNDSYLNGLSAKTLYVRLINKLKNKLEKTGGDAELANIQHVEPWSGEAINIKKRKSIDETIDSLLMSVGIKNTICYAPEVLSELRCYALMTILDPFVALKGMSVIARSAGLSAKTLKTMSASNVSLAQAKTVMSDKAALVLSDIRNFGSTSVYHRYDGIRKYPALINKIDSANMKVLRARFPKPFASVKDLENLNWKDYGGGFIKQDKIELMNSSFKNLDSEVKTSMKDAINHLNDKHSFINYMEKLNSEVVRDIEKRSIPSELDFLKKGKITEAATIRVLNQRAESNRILKMNSASQSEKQLLINEKYNLAHKVQADYLNEAFTASKITKPEKLWSFLSTKEGGGYWSPLLDSSKRNSLSHLEFIKTMTKLYTK